MPNEFFHGTPGIPSRFGTDIAGAGTPIDLFLRVFGGEVMTHFYANTMMQGKHYTRPIRGAKSARFPRLYKMDAEYHVPGTEMLGQTTIQTEVEITLDALLVSYFALYDLDEAMTHFDIRQPYAEGSGRAIAEVYDKNVMRQIVLAARMGPLTALFPDAFPGGSTVDAAFLTAAGTGVDLGFAGGTTYAAAEAAGAAGAWLVAAARAIRQQLRLMNVPDSLPMYGVISPTIFDRVKYARLNDAAATYAGDLIFQKLDIRGNDGGAQGGLTAGTIDTITIEGITFYPSTLVPDVDESLEPKVWPKYRADFGGTIGMVWSPMAVGTLELLGMRVELMRDVRRQEDFMVASTAAGHGALRQELAFEIRND